MSETGVAYINCFGIHAIEINGKRVVFEDRVWDSSNNKPIEVVNIFRKFLGCEEWIKDEYEEISDEDLEKEKPISEAKIAELFGDIDLN